MIIEKSDQATFWQQHVGKFKASGQSRAAYCREQGLKDHQLAYHLGQLVKGKGPVHASSFVQVAVAEAPPPPSTRPSCVRLVVGRSAAMEFDTSVDPVWVARLVAAVGGDT